MVRIAAARRLRQLAELLAPSRFACGTCRDLGWVLESTGRDPLRMELIACPVPGCARSERRVDALRIPGPVPINGRPRALAHDVDRPSDHHIVFRAPCGCVTGAAPANLAHRFAGIDDPEIVPTNELLWHVCADHQARARHAGVDL